MVDFFWPNHFDTNSPRAKEVGVKAKIHNRHRGGGGRGGGQTHIIYSYCRLVCIATQTQSLALGFHTVQICALRLFWYMNYAL